MKIQRTPQDKKLFSYKKDCRNVYGENDKSSRKAIRQRKRWVNQSYRRAVKQNIVENLKLLDRTLEVFDGRVIEVRKKGWKKVPDKSLGFLLKAKGIDSRLLNCIPAKSQY